MTEILSQDEITGLLNAIASGAVDTTDYKDMKEHKKITIYNFRRPDKFSKDHIRTLQMMHESFARFSTTMLSAKLRALAGIHVASVDQLTYEEFIRSIPNPTLIAAVNFKPLPGAIIMEVDPSLTFTIVDLLAGGPGYASRISREHSDIELMLLEDICNGLVSNLKYSWTNVLELEPELSVLETNPQFVQIVPPDDMIVLITLETKIGCVEGMINIAIPYITVEPVLEKLSAQYMYMYSPVTAGRETTASADFSRVLFKRHLEYSGVVNNITLDDLRKLKPGMRIPLGHEIRTKAVYECACRAKGGEND